MHFFKCSLKIKKNLNSKIFGPDGGQIVAPINKGDEFILFLAKPTEDISPDSECGVVGVGVRCENVFLSFFFSVLTQNMK